VLSFASQFEDFTDNLVFNVVGSLVPLAFASVVLWRYDPLLVVGLIGVIAITGAGIAPLIRRRQRLVDQREEAIARVSGHVADSLMNMDTIRAFAAEDREAAEHRKRVADQRRKSVRSWDYANLRIDALVAPMTVLTNVLGLLLAVALGAGQHGIEAIIVAFTYYSNATKIMFEFNQIYRQLESSLTEAAQFTELLFTRPAVVDPIAPEPLRPAASDVRFERVSFAHPGGLPLFTGLDLAVPSGTKLGLVGRSGGGKTTLTRLLLRMMDVGDGRILIGGQDIARLRQSDLRSLIAYVPQDPAMFHRTLRDNIAFARPDATDAEIRQAGAGGARDRVRRRPSGRVRHDGRRAGREAVRRAAAASRARPGDPAGRADPAARRGDQRAGLRERSPCPAGVVAAHGGPDRARGRAPAEHGRAHGPVGRARPRPDRREGHASGAAASRRNLRQAVAAPVRRLPGRQHDDRDAARGPEAERMSPLHGSMPSARH
jgi:ABC-type multidrug transport system fused ATPase/permease subunit